MMRLQTAVRSAVIALMTVLGGCESALDTVSVVPVSSRVSVGDDVDGVDGDLRSVGSAVYMGGRRFLTIDHVVHGSGVQAHFSEYGVWLRALGGARHALVELEAQHVLPQRLRAGALDLVTPVHVGQEVVIVGISYEMDAKTKQMHGHRMKVVSGYVIECKEGLPDEDRPLNQFCVHSRSDAVGRGWSGGAVIPRDDPFRVLGLIIGGDGNTVVVARR